MKCADASTLLSAYTDGETNMLQGHSIRRHLQACPSCAATLRKVDRAARADTRRSAAPFRAPGASRARARDARRGARVCSAAGASAPANERWRWLSGGALAGCAATVLAWVVGTAVIDWRASEDLAVEAVTCTFARRWAITSSRSPRRTSTP